MGEKKKPVYIQYLFGGLSGIGATCVVQPLDLVKTRMQISGLGGAVKEYNNTFDAIAKIVRREGALALYKGLSAAIMRQATYTTTRLGVYTSLNDAYKQKMNKAPNLLESMAMGMTAGAVGSFVGNPCELILIRMTADGRLPVAERRNYSNFFNAFVRIAKEEGVLALWRGCIPTMGRAMVVNAAQLASYSQAKAFLVNNDYIKEGIGLHFTASMFSGLITTAASLPVDIAKTRIQNMKIVPGEIPPYKNTVDVIVKVIRHEGITALWKGFTAYYARLGPHTVLTFILLEQLNGLYNEHFLGGKGPKSGL
ncbi:mitochondrial 2-oxoglutarate/malate carrier protein-like [Topomyia yanbarensis]|uniref:mitochondrial 2-oxoglutarate/malate carrier protein-like n=1 Tax=Topomyia yanbarensis TaxID=2498891 RepID=UPI00273B7138|nr:mitochondrial 2-oxoglutarate/malate carrier protein-like [Topomyia yanbarensis]